MARYVHRQNPDTTEIWDGEVLPETFISKKFEKGVYYNPYLMRTITSSFKMASGPFEGLEGLVFEETSQQHK